LTAPKFGSWKLEKISNFKLQRIMKKTKFTESSAASARLARWFDCQQSSIIWFLGEALLARKGKAAAGSTH
jgi:hypothetical protein